MKTSLLSILSALACASATVHAIDDFNVQMSKAMHEDTAIAHDIYTRSESSGLWDLQYPWFQKPAFGLRFNTTQQERMNGFTALFESELYSPMFSGSFQTIGGINVGLAYSHGFLSEDQSLGGIRQFQLEGDVDSVGGYVAKQWDCGFKLGATWAYSTGDYGFEGGRSLVDFDTVGASGAVGFARSFGDKKSWRNAFADTSANFLYQSEEEAWYFVWMAKAGHNLCERFAVYGVFNLYYELDYGHNRLAVPLGFAGYRPYGDDTWGEAGGGFQAHLCRGLTFSAEATTPVFDENYTAMNAFQVRGGLHWTF